MSVIYLLLPLALLLAGAAVAAFIWAARKGQLDDLVTPAVRAILDDAPARERPTVAPPGDEAPDPAAFGCGPR
ncbi:MAG: cbb3-type cytochrome oxidase assembly protein CcoS [Deltaproteobacteria bacterium]|nr:cbb3-type cytochrome oxidase assembly protein CcoS [Deltaproteobacteria bacterium]